MSALCLRPALHRKEISLRRYLLALLLALSSFGAGAEPAPSADAEIRSLVERFRQSIIEKDTRTFLSLFLHGRITWQEVLSGEQHRLASRDAPGTPKARYDTARSPETFIAGIAGAADRFDEPVWNISIDTDGTAASVAFDFRFVRNGEIRNEGREYWLLVRTEAGWKIAAVVWSRNRSPGNRGPEARGTGQDRSRAGGIEDGEEATRAAHASMEHPSTP